MALNNDKKKGICVKYFDIKKTNINLIIFNERFVKNIKIKKETVNYNEWVWLNLELKLFNCLKLETAIVE